MLLKAASNKLVKMTSPPSGYQVFNGCALVALGGQGAMYFEPLFTNQEICNVALCNILK